MYTTRHTQKELEPSVHSKIRVNNGKQLGASGNRVKPSDARQSTLLERNAGRAPFAKQTPSCTQRTRPNKQLNHLS